MTQTKAGVRPAGRLVKTAATSALALTAVAGGILLGGGKAIAAPGPCPGSPVVGTKFTDICTILSENFTTVSLVVTTPVSVFVPIPPSDGLHSWVTLDVDNGGVGPIIGTGTYSVQKIGGYYDQVQLRATPPAFGNWSVNKKVYSDSLLTNLLADLTVDQNTIGGKVSANLPNTYSVLYFTDTVAGAGSPRWNNDFHNVPAPLPILGAGAAFGSVRKMRKFSTQLKAFTMV